MIKTLYEDMKSDKRTYLILLILFLLTNIFFIWAIFFYASAFQVSITDYYKLLFDNEHYIKIAESGYSLATRDDCRRICFFPLIPILIKCFGIYGTVVINNIAFLFNTFLIYFIGKKEYKIDKSELAAAIYIISPMHLFSVMCYTETLLMTFTLLAILFYKNKKYLYCGLCLGLGVCTRVNMVAMFFAIFISFCIDFFKNKEKSEKIKTIKNIFICYIPATIISCLYPIYLWIRFGNPLLFTSFQYEYWLKGKSTIFTILFDGARALKETAATPKFQQDVRTVNISIVYTILDAFIMILVIGITIYLIKKMKKAFLIENLYLILTFLIVTSTYKICLVPFCSYYRYLLNSFPLLYFFPINYFSNDNKTKKLTGYTIFVVIMFFTMYVTTKFCANYYFY